MSFATNSLHLWLCEFVAKDIRRTPSRGLSLLAAKVVSFQTAPNTYCAEALRSLPAELWEAVTQTTIPSFSADSLYLARPEMRRFPSRESA